MSASESSRTTRRPGQKEWPLVSIVLPVRNVERDIAKCLDAVLHQTYPPHLIEILVVDGNSHDQTGQIVADYSKDDPRITLLHNPFGTIPAGLNVGIQAATGDVIARVDARTLLAPDYIQTAIALLAESGADNVGGPVRTVTSSLRGKALALAWSTRFGLGAASSRYQEATEEWTDTVYLGVYPRRVFETIGLYDEQVIQDEDADLNYRLRAHGGRILLSPRLRSSYLSAPALSRLVWKYFLFGYSKVLVWRKHPTMLSWRHFLPPLIVAGLLLGPVLAQVHLFFGIVWIAGASGYFLSCLLIAGILLLQGAGREALLLPIIFPTLHLSWGSGFLVGSVRFFFRWFQSKPTPLLLEPKPPSFQQQTETAFGLERV